ncbi:MAG TPA: hypothetical protein VEJ84_19185 [Acidimicrobiales bacterium]|nr:hypothetical protein [Acidimicrobiales bacterium]
MEKHIISGFVFVMARARHEPKSLSQLTDRQLDVLALMAEGPSHARIARTHPLSSRYDRWYDHTQDRG